MTADPRKTPRPRTPTPRGSPPWVHRDLPRCAPPASWGALRCARVPPVDYVDDPLPPQSPVPISLSQQKGAFHGKIQGISSIRSLAVPGRQRKGARNQFLTGQFPTHPNREFFAALQGIKSGDQGSFRRDRGIPLSSAILAFAPGDKSDRPDRFPTLPRRRKGRQQMLEVAEADLDASFCLCERRAGHGGNRSPNLSTRTIGVPGWHRSRRAPPAEPSSTVAGGPRVRIHLPPAASLSQQ